MGKQVAASIKKKRPWETMGQACAGGQGIRKRRAGDSGGWQKQPQRAGRSRPASTLKTPYRSEMGKRNLSKKKRYQAYRHPRNKQARKKQACMQESMQAGRREQERCNAMQQERPSKKGRRADALALRADERRDKLRKAAGRGKCPVIRRCLNGETRMGRIPCIHARIHNAWRGTRRTETSK